LAKRLGLPYCPTAIVKVIEPPKVESPITGGSSISSHLRLGGIIGDMKKFCVGRAVMNLVSKLG
jgi:hypothetical protein